MTRTCSRYVRTGSRVRRRRRTSWSTNLRRRSDPNRHGETESRQTPVSGVRIADIVARQQILQWIDRPDVYTSRVRAIHRGLLPRPDCLHRRYRCSRSMSLDVTSTSETVRRSRDGGGVRLSCSHSSTAWHANAPDARVSWSVTPRTGHRSPHRTPSPAPRNRFEIHDVRGFAGRVTHGRPVPTGRSAEDVRWNEKLREDQLGGAGWQVGHCGPRTQPRGRQLLVAGFHSSSVGMSGGVNPSTCP